MTELPEQLLGAEVRSVQLKRGALHVGFEGRFYFEIQAPWLTENLATGDECHLGDIVGLRLVSVSASARDLEIAFGSHRVRVALHDAQRKDQFAAILFEADWPFVKW